MTTRSTQDVFDDHLQLRKQGDLEADIRRNFADDVIVMSEFGLFRSHDGVRQSAHLLDRQLPTRRYHFAQCLTDQEVAFERWDAATPQVQVKNGIDFFLIRDGRIQLQLIYYKPQPTT